MLRKIRAVFKTRCKMQISPFYHLWLFYGIFLWESYGIH